MSPRIIINAAIATAGIVLGVVINVIPNVPDAVSIAANAVAALGTVFGSRDGIAAAFMLLPEVVQREIVLYTGIVLSAAEGVLYHYVNPPTGLAIGVGALAAFAGLIGARADVMPTVNMRRRGWRHVHESTLPDGGQR